MKMTIKTRLKVFLETLKNNPKRLFGRGPKKFKSIRDQEESKFLQTK